MNSTFKRAVIFIVNFFIVIGCYIIDRPNARAARPVINEHTVYSKTTEVNRSAKARENSINNNEKATTKEKADQSNESPVVLHLAQGIVGSLAEKEYKGAYVYEKPNAYSGEVARLHYNCCMEIDDNHSTKDWVALRISKDGSLGYIKRSEMKEVTLSVGGEKYDRVRNGIVKEAIAHLGQDYSVKGKTIDKTNCNTFAQLIYKDHGLNIPNSPNAQKKASTIIPESEALPGDLIYYHANNGSGHIGIYLADGYIINSAGHDGKEYPAGGVRICRINYHDREEYEVCRMF